MVGSEDILFDLDGGGLGLSLVGRPPRLFSIVSGSNPYTATPVYLLEADGTRPDDGTDDITAAMNLLWEVNGVTTVAAGTVVEATPNAAGVGWYFTNPAKGKPSRYPLGPACLVPGTAGGIAGLSQIWYDPATGEAVCEFTALCEGTPCEGDDVDGGAGGGGGGAPPSGTGIVTVSGGAWGTPGPLTGDVTTTGAGLAATIANDAVTLAKMADVATATVFYRKTAGTGDPEVQALATLKTDLGLTGTNSGDQTITLTGDVTGSGTGSFAATIANDAVTDAKLRNSSALSVIGRSANSTGDPADIVGGTVGHVLQVLTGPTLGFGAPASASAEAVLSANWTISAATGTFQAITGWTLSVPATGTYNVTLEARGGTEATSAGNFVVVRLTNNGSTVTDTALMIAYAGAANVLNQNSGCATFFNLSLTSGDTLGVEVKREFSGSSTNAVVSSNSTNGQSRLGYQRVG